MTKQSNKHPDGAEAGAEPLADEQAQPLAPSPEAVQAYQAFEAELFKREVSNAEAYDKAVLLYSTGALGLSLTFIKDIVPPGQATCLWLLYLSWLSFLAAMVIMLISYLVGQKAIRCQRDLAYEVYYEGKTERTKPEYNPWSKRTDHLNVGSGACFVLGAALMTWFVASNIALREKPVALAQPSGQSPGTPTSATITFNTAPAVVFRTPADPQLDAVSQPRQAAPAADEQHRAMVSH